MKQDLCDLSHFRHDNAHLEYFQQCVHVEPANAKGHAKHRRHDDEDQQECEPHGEGDAQEHADQPIEGEKIRLHDCRDPGQ